MSFLKSKISSSVLDVSSWRSCAIDLAVPVMSAWSVKEAEEEKNVNMNLIMVNLNVLSNYSERF